MEGFIMIDTLVIIVYDRLQNLEKWFSILKRCTKPKNVVVIHTGLADYYGICLDNNVMYIKRPNIGYDIGAFQDVCMNRLPGFPDWQQLLWCTDDTFPMQENFLDYFALKSNEGVRCMEISPYVREHIRTTGFSIIKNLAVKLKFPADPVVTKQHCYMFEHRMPRGIFINQVRAHGYKVVMVAPKENSPLFDTGYHRRQPRDKELNDKWGFTTPLPAKVNPKVTVICPVYNTFPEIISSMICQTYKDWELLLIHDGPNTIGLQVLIEAINDDRIKYIESPAHKGFWGHSYRAEYLQKAEGQYILITNADNHHTPVYLEYMLKGFADGVVATYCDSMVHSYKAWQVIPCMLQRGYLDCAGVLVKTEAAKAVGWHSLEHSADWLYFQGLMNKYGPKSFVKIKGCLLIHN